MPKVIDYKDLPSEPGCYLFKDKVGEVLYVGKAKDIRKRVASYFTKGDLDPKTELLVKHIDSVDYMVTGNEVEALLLENNLIKKYYPRYNIDLKDSRRYAYLRLTNDSLPYLEVARDREADGQYFGPFTSGRLRKEIQRVLARRFGVLTQKPSGLKKKTIDPAGYNEKLKNVLRILKGDVNGLIVKMEKEMEEASEKTHFEHAMKLRNQIEALNLLKERQNVELRRRYEADIINFLKSGENVYLMLFNVYKGILENKQEFELSYSEEFLEEFIVQYYSRNKVPRELILPVEVDPAISGFLSESRGRGVRVFVPTRGVKKALLDLARKNVEIAVSGERGKVNVLQKSLKLESEPRRIECFDISHYKGKDTVASMVTFWDGKPLKSAYRKFKIQSVGDGDDFGAMREVIYRRYAKSLKDSLPMPDLIVIDGGAGQLSSTVSVLKDLGVDVPVIALAKKLEEIYVAIGKKPLQLGEKNQGLLLLRRIRDEAHRFAISYNRKLRSGLFA